MIGLTGHVIDVCFCLAELFMCKVLSLFMANSAHVRGMMTSCRHPVEYCIVGQLGGMSGVHGSSRSSLKFP